MDQHKVPGLAANLSTQTGIPHEIRPKEVNGSIQECSRFAAFRALQRDPNGYFSQSNGHRMDALIPDPQRATVGAAIVAESKILVRLFRELLPTRSQQTIWVVVSWR